MGEGGFVWFAMRSFFHYFVLEDITLVRFTSWRFVVILYLFDFRSSWPPQTFRSNVLRVSFPVTYEEREQIDQKKVVAILEAEYFFCWNTYFAVLPYNWQVAKRARKGPKLWVVTNALRKSIWRWSSLEQAQRVVFVLFSFVFGFFFYFLCFFVCFLHLCCCLVMNGCFFWYLCKNSCFIDIWKNVTMWKRKERHLFSCFRREGCNLRSNLQKKEILRIENWEKKLKQKRKRSMKTFTELFVEKINIEKQGEQGRA